VINTLRQALEIAATDDTGTVAVVVDAYHVWWDPDVDAAIAEAGERIAAFQVCDWVTPLPEGALTGRGVMGDGVIDLSGMRAAVEKAGYHGPVEVEIFSDRWRREPPADLLDLLVERYLRRVVDPTP
jgi:sugar phosphate isomerase/epimerase